MQQCLADDWGHLGIVIAGALVQNLHASSNGVDSAIQMQLHAFYQPVTSSNKECRLVHARQKVYANLLNVQSQRTNGGAAVLICRAAIVVPLK